MKHLMVWFRVGPNVVQSPRKDSITGVCLCVQ